MNQASCSTWNQCAREGPVSLRCALYSLMWLTVLFRVCLPIVLTSAAQGKDLSWTRFFRKNHEAEGE